MKTFILSLILSIALFGNNDKTTNQFNQLNKNFFIENKGQWPSEVIYLARVGGMNAWITNSGVVYDYFQINSNNNEIETLKMTSGRKEQFEKRNTSIKGHVVKMNFVDAEKFFSQQGINKQEGYYNYFIGNDKNKWSSFVPLYGNIELKNIYQNINVKYYFDGNSIRYDYIVKPGADLSKLRLKFEGQESIRVNDAGELVIITSLGEVTNGKLFSYQLDNGKKAQVNCRFLKNEDETFSIDVSGYDKNSELIIDPLIFSTFIGGSGWDFGDDCGNAITIDSSGNSYITGYTFSRDFPKIPGAYDTTVNTYWGAAFVTKINSKGTGLIYSTLIGAWYGAKGNSITIDNNGNVFLAGQTAADFPCTPGAFQKTFGGNSCDGFVTKFNSTGSGLIYSTLLGGNEDDKPSSIKIDPEGNAYITGQTYSSNFPTTPGAFQTGLNGAEDVFVTKLNPQGTGLVYSTLIGGLYLDHSYSIAIDSSKNVYITGETSSTNFPTTPGSFQPFYAEGNKDYQSDGFITKINPTGSKLIYSTYLGSSGKDICNAIAVDYSGNAFITGSTSSSNFPVTSGAFQTIYGGGGQYDADGFVTKLNSEGTKLVYSTFLGGWGDDCGTSIAIDPSGNAYLTGYTKSSNFPTTLGAFQNIIGGGGFNDVFVTELNTTGSHLIYSTFLGGNNDDYGHSIAIDTSSNAYLTGLSSSSNYPTTPGVFQNYLKGPPIRDYSADIIVTKINLKSDPHAITSPNGGEKWLAGETKNITWLNFGPNNVNIQYSTNLGASWNIVTASYPADADSFLWTVPLILSKQYLVKISDIVDTSINDISSAPFIVWQPIVNTQIPIAGQNYLNFGPANIYLDLYVLTPANISATYIEYESPKPGVLPSPISAILPGCYWKISAPDTISFINGYIHVPYSWIGVLDSFYHIFWLKRTNPGDAWTNIGGVITNGNFINTIHFSSFSEFAIGYYLAPTPIELISFNGQSIGGMISLKWSTATELNNRGFEIQRKSSSYDYITVAFVNGNGTTTKINSYSFSEKMQPGIYSYRLKQVDYDGKFKYSNEVEIVLVPKSFSLAQNYPNPFNPSTTIKYTIPSESKISITVYNSLGQNVRQFNLGSKQPGFYDLNFNSNGLPSGVYFYSIKAISVDGRNDFNAVKKMIILK